MILLKIAKKILIWRPIYDYEIYEAMLLYCASGSWTAAAATDNMMDMIIMVSESQHSSSCYNIS